MTGGTTGVAIRFDREIGFYNALKRQICASNLYLICLDH
jgi:hypothetical protein